MMGQQGPKPEPHFSSPLVGRLFELERERERILAAMREQEKCMIARAPVVKIHSKTHAVHHGRQASWKTGLGL